MSDTTAPLEASLGHQFRNPELLLTALTHPSYAAECDPPVPDNQRFEFLGDAILLFLTAELVFEQHPDLQEGHLTKIRSTLTKQETLAVLARQIGLGPCLRLGKGEDRAGGRDRPSNLGDAFEAVLAALYLDGGVEPVRALCQRLLADTLTDPEEILARENPKGALQELTQELHQTTPVYEVVKVSGLSTEGSKYRHFCWNKWNVSK